MTCASSIEFFIGFRLVEGVLPSFRDGVRNFFCDLGAECCQVAAHVGERDFVLELGKIDSFIKRFREVVFCEFCDIHNDRSVGFIC